MAKDWSDFGNISAPASGGDDWSKFGEIEGGSRSTADIVSGGVQSAWDAIPSSGKRKRDYDSANAASHGQAEAQVTQPEPGQPGEVPYNQATGRNEIDGTILDAAGDFGSAVAGLPADFAASARGAVVGNDPRAVAESDLIKAQSAPPDKAATVHKYGLGLDSNDIKSGVQSIPFSVLSMAAYLGGAAPTAAVTKNPIAAHAAGMAASGAAAYRMDTSQVLGQLYNAANAQFEKQTGRKMSPAEFNDFASSKEVQSEVFKHGAAEAGFEAVGNLITSSAFGAALKGTVGRALGQEAVDASVKTAAKDAGRFAVAKAAVQSQAGELATETPTQLAQNQAEVALGLQNGPAPEWTSVDDWGKAFREVVYPTLITGGLMAGGVKAVQAPLDAYSNKRLAGKIAEFIGNNGHAPANDAQLQGLYQRTLDLTEKRPDDEPLAAALNAIQAEVVLRSNSPKGFHPENADPDAAPGGDVTAGDVLGTPDATPIQTETDKALYTPKSLTALDRVNEIDSQPITPELQAERDGITATWPKATPGAATSFTTEAGSRLDGQYALMEADDLTTSHDESLRPVPTYPAELQPRERERHASEMQIQGIVQKLDPARLGESADVATGAPIVGADGLVESGNARTIALKRIHRANGLKSENYKQFVRDNAARFGLDPAAIDQMQKPVLVRVRATPVNRAEFARQANASTVARMSPSEQAKSDAAQIDSLDDLNPDESGDFTSGASSPFVRRFMAKLAGTEQSGMVDATGQLSQAGYSRIRNAVLAKAYGDSPVLLRMMESLDDNTRNLTKALMRVAPKVAKVRESISEGALHDADMTPDLMMAVEALSRIKDAGGSVRDELAQAGMFGDSMTPEARDFLSFLDDNMRSPKRVADFIQAYIDALEAAGNPGQGSLLGDATAPTKRDLITAAKRGKDGKDSAENASGRQPGSGEKAAVQDQQQPANAPGDRGGTQGNEAEVSGGQGEWVAFPPDTGTLGIPRADMPQVKGDHRGALIQFLDARGISHKTVEMPASELKPTQAEFSTKKAEKWKEVREGTDRSVLASSDGYILDGHHQWVAALANGETEQVIQFDAPIKELLAAVYQFPSVQRSEGSNVVELRAKARNDFKDAMADLAQIASKHTRAAMLPEDTPGLMPTLIKLSSAAIAEVGYTIGDIIAHVKKALKANRELKAFWNKVDNATYRKAAAQAAEQTSRAHVDDLFAAADASRNQGDLFAQPAPAPDAKKAMHDAAAKAAEKKVEKEGGLTYQGAPFIIKDSNFNFTIDSAKLLRAVVGDEVVDRAARVVKENKQPKDEAKLTPEEQERAEKIIKPKLDLAAEAKSAYDQLVLDAAEASGVSIGVMLADLKGIGRAAVKLVNDEKWEVNGIKDLLRSTVVVKTYEEAQDVIAEIKKRFQVTRIKNRSMTSLSGPKLTEDDRKKFGGYADVLINVKMPNGTIAEIQINVPAMLAGKDQEGHALYEIYRDLDKESAQAIMIAAEMESFYDAVFQSRAKPASLAEFRKLPSPIGAQDLGKADQGKSEAPSSDNLNILPSGNTAKSSPENDAQNLQPSGNLSGTFIGSTPSGSSIAKKSSSDYNESEGKPKGDENGQDGNNSSVGAQGKEPGAASPTGEPGQAPGIRDGSRGPDQRPDRNADDGTGSQAGGEQSQEPAGKSRDPESVRGDSDGDRSGRNAGVPAGRDIPAKTGRNYAFGDGDLTYTGSWHAKARQNVEAVELLKQLEKDGRQATREEQATLAKFIGWGSSEIANSIFGDKLNKQIEAIDQYNDAIAAMDSSGQGYLSQRDRGFWQAFQVLKFKNPGLEYYSIQRIARAELMKAKPDASASKWADLRDRLKAAMTDEEWDAASRSTQYAHYTSKPVVKALLGAVSKMGFKGGTILEPGAGIGVFPGLMASDVGTNSIYTGIEFDPITGGILKQLFPDERILVESFIDSKLPENFYDVAFGNPPFGAFKVLADPKYVKHAFALHDYFFAKSLDSVKPGGLLVFVTSRYTMDKKGDKARSYMAERADLVGAIRLPQTAFQKNAGTEVVTDILFLRKKVPGQTFDQAQPWLELGEVQTDKAPALVNQYFAAHPEMVMGTHARAGKMYSKDEYTVLPNGGDIEAQIVAAVENLPADVFVAGRGSAAEAAKVREMDFDPKAKKEGSFYVSDAGVLMQREGGVGVQADAKYQKDAEVIKDYVSLRDAVKQSQLDQLTDGDWESSLRGLQKAYAAFQKKHGRLLQNTTYMQRVKVEELDEDGVPTGNKIEDEEQRRRYPLRSKIQGDTEYTLVLALEDLNEETGEVKDSKWLTERTLNKPAAAEVRTPADALLATLDESGVIDMRAVAARIGLSEQETIDSLGTLVYEDPAQGWVMADEYLSGNVKKKLAAAEEAARSDKAYQRNVEALKAVQPVSRSPDQITPQIGMNWIPGEVYEQFLEDVTGVKAKIEYVKRTRDWVLTTISGEGTAKATADWGVGDKAHAGWLMEKALTGAAISLNKSVSDGKGGSKQVFDPDRTEAANEKRAELRKKFQEWLFQDADRTTELVQLYNDKFNTNVQRKFDGTHLTLPGLSNLYHIWDHVKRGAWRVIQTGNTYLAHAVGSGKTLEMVISAMEQKRLGKIKKPMFIVPGHMLQQMASEWQQAYPTARLMVADEENFHTENRRRFVSRVAMSDLDGVIMTHSSFGLLDLDPAFKQKMIEQELEVLRASYVEAGGDLDQIGEKKGGKKDPKIKRIESQIEKLEQQLAKAMSSDGKDKNVRFDEMGVDMLYVDEAHLFRKLSFATARQTKGIDPQGSQMAWDLYMKTRWLAEKNPTRNLVMASGTAITNTTAELYTVQRFMAPQVLEENGLSGFDDWASQFGEESTTIESTASGKYEPVTRFQEFVNVGEMTQMFRDFADVLNEDHLAALLGDKRPKVVGGSRKMVITPKTETYATFLKEDLAPRIEVSRKWKPSFEQQYNPDPIIAINIDARLASIDMRFMDPKLPNDPDSKLNQMIDGVIRVYKENEGNEYRGKSPGKDAEGKDIPGPVESIKGAAQMVFFESGFGKMVAQRRGFNARAWMEKRLRDAGIPASQLAFMEDYKKSSAKLKLFADVNKGKVRVLVGSSAAMGTGVNAQQRLIALHHLDAPYVPAILEQREGRIVRQGNKNPDVQIYAYSTFGSFDENLWQMLARKKFFIEQAMSGDPNIRKIEDVGEVNQLQMAAGLVAENPFVMQHAGAKADVDKMTRLYRNHEDQRAKHRDDYENAGRTIDYNEQWLPDQEKAAARVKDLHGDLFTGKAGGKDFATRKDWGAAILGKYKDLADALTEKPVKIGELSGFDVMFAGERNGTEYRTTVRLMTPVPAPIAFDPSMDPVGMAMRAVNALVEVSRKPAETRKIISEAKDRRNSLESRLDAPFPLAEQLSNKIKEMADLEQQMLNYGKAPARVTLFDPDEWANAYTPLFKRSPSITGRLSTEQVKKVIDQAVKGLRNPPVTKYVATAADLPFEAPADTAGVFWNGRVWMVAENITSAEHAREVFAHETLGHYGLRGFFGAMLDGALSAIHDHNPRIRLSVTEWKLKNADLIETYKTKYGMNDADVHGIAIEEAMSNWAQERGAIKGMLRLVGLVQKALRAMGMNAWANTLEAKTNAEALQMLQQARMFVRDGTRLAEPMTPVLYPAMADSSMADDSAKQEKWLDREAKLRGFKSIDDLAEKNYKVFEKLAALWRKQNPVEVALFSRSVSAAPKPETRTADDIINQRAATARPIDAVLKGVTQAARVDRLTMGAYNKAAFLLDRYTPETIKAGVISDYGIPEAVTDMRAVVQGRQREQTRAAGELLEKLATLTRAEARVAYQWMNSADPQSSDYFINQLPAESIRVLADVEKMIDDLSKEAVALGQLDPEAFKRNRYSYLHRSYQKHEAELSKGDKAMRKRSIAILGDQYKGRGMTDAAPMRQIQNIAPEWWKRKTQAGRADKGLKGEKFIRLERRQPVGAGTAPIPGTEGKQQKPKLLELAYWPANEPVPARYGAWERAGTWEVRDTKGNDLVLWRDFTAQEREALGEIDDVRYAIAKTLHGMIHDVETGRYLKYLAENHAKKEGEKIDGTIVGHGEGTNKQGQTKQSMSQVFTKGEWVQVPDTVIVGTKVKKYGALAGRYLPGPIWNDVRQVVGFRYQPIGEAYASIHRAWKTSKTALSPGVHMNNVMANFVMADWHDVSAGHVLKALKLMLSKDPAAIEVRDRFGDSGGSIGTWAAKELQAEQLRPIIDAMERELGLAANSAAQVGAMSALQLALRFKFAESYGVLAPTKAGKAAVAASRAMIDMYEAEDQVFRLAAWLKAKEDGATDREAGKLARKSFLDYSINAPWIQMARSTLLPFVAFTYRAVPMMLETAARKPWKLLKLGMMAGAVNALGYMLSGGDEDDERKLLPEEKSGKVWGVVPKLIRMPWNDANGSPVFLDVRRWVPAGDVFDVGQTHSAIPILPSMTPGGPLIVLAELLPFNLSTFTGKKVVLETDTTGEATAKVLDHLFKAFAPNIPVLPGTYSWTSIGNAGKGKTDAFGREQNLPQAIASAFGVKLAAYPKDVLQFNAQQQVQFKLMEIDRNISKLGRELQKKGIDADEFSEKVAAQNEKKIKIIEEFGARMAK